MNDLVSSIVLGIALLALCYKLWRGPRPDRWGKDWL